MLSLENVVNWDNRIILPRPKAEVNKIWWFAENLLFWLEIVMDLWNNGSPDQYQFAALLLKIVAALLRYAILHKQSPDPFHSLLTLLSAVILRLCRISEKFKTPMKGLRLRLKIENQMFWNPKLQDFVWSSSVKGQGGLSSK